MGQVGSPQTNHQRLLKLLEAIEVAPGQYGITPNESPEITETVGRRRIEQVIRKGSPQTNHQRLLKLLSGTRLPASGVGSPQTNHQRLLKLRVQIACTFCDQRDHPKRITRDY